MTLGTVRACDIDSYGVEIADRTWPEPNISALNSIQVNLLGSALCNVLAQARQEIGDAEWAVNPLRTSDERIVYSDELVPVPLYLPPRMLNADETQALRDACIKELSGVDAKTVIDNFVAFCELLRKPENHVLGPSWQYVEKAVPSRTVSDMTNEMAQELAGLAHYTAYARLIEEKDGRQMILKEKIATIPLPRIMDESRAEVDKREKVIEENSKRYLKRRDVIEEEIKKRQDAKRCQA